MNIFSIKKESTLKRSILLILSVLVFSLSFSVALLFADSNSGDEHGKPLDVVLQEIRDAQGIGPEDPIDARSVSDEQLEELGEAVMSRAHPDPKEHEFMDNMMGGEGSRRLARMHRRMGYHYLVGGYDYNDDMMDSGMMMWNRRGDRRSGMMGGSRLDRGMRSGDRSRGGMMGENGGMM